MKRTGKCLRTCWFCCVRKNRDLYFKDLYEIHVCPWLRLNEKKEGVCLLEKMKTKPAQCIKFPRDPKCVPDICGYKFYENGKEIKKG